MTADAIWAYLSGHIANPYGVAGLMGNLYAESTLNPIDLEGAAEKRFGLTDQQYTDAVDSGEYDYDMFAEDGAGYGIAQWTHPSRKRALYRFTVGEGRSIGDLQAQLDFLWDELQSYPAVLGVLQSAQSVREASDAVLHGYERPRNQSSKVEEKRAAYGQRYYDQFSKEALPVGVTSAQLIADFRRMLDEKWGYIPSTSGELWTQERQDKKAEKDSGVAKYGSRWIGHHVADCSGAFVAAYRQHGLSIYQGSNRIARRYIDALHPISEAKPGMAAFKAYRPGDKYYSLPADYKPGGAYYNGDLLDYYHIGLVDANPSIILNSANIQNGFRESAKDGWEFCGYLKDVDYTGGKEPSMMQPKQMIVTAETGKTVNLRSGPGTEYPKIDAVPIGTIVTETMESNGWAYIQYGGKQGYMMEKFLADYTPEPEPEPSVDIDAAMRYLLSAQEQLRKGLEILNSKG